MSDAAIRCDPAPMAEVHAISTRPEFSVLIPCKLTGFRLLSRPTLVRITIFIELLEIKTAFSKKRSYLLVEGLF